MDEYTTMKACFFTLACVVAGGIIADNHPIKDMAIHWAPIPHVVSKGPPLSVNRRVTDIMAVMTLITAFASLFTKLEQLTIVYAYIDDRGIVHREARVALGYPFAVLLIVTSGVMLAADGHFTWHRYVLGRQLSCKTVPKWQSVLAYLYIWLFIIVPWHVMNVLEQINVRDEKFWEKTGLHSFYKFGAIHSLLMMPLHVAWSCLMLLIFLRDLRSLRWQVEEQGLPSGSERMLIVSALTYRSIAYVFISLFSFFYCWIVFCLYPVCVYLAITATPYFIVQSLTTHACFNLRTWRTADEEEEALTIMPTGTALHVGDNAALDPPAIPAPGTSEEAAVAPVPSLTITTVDPPPSPVRQRRAPQQQHPQQLPPPPPATDGSAEVPRRGWHGGQLPNVRFVHYNHLASRGVVWRISEGSSSSSDSPSSASAAGALESLPSEALCFKSASACASRGKSTSSGAGSPSYEQPGEECA